MQDGVRVRADRELTVLKAVFNRMREWKKYEGPNPVQGVAFLPEPQRRVRYLEADEEAGLVACAPEPLRSVIRVGIHAGLRIRSEALQLRWTDIDLRRALLTVPAAYAKNGTSRSVPMNSTLREMFTKMKSTAASDNCIFISRTGKPLRSIRNALESACRAAKLRDVTPHTFRHTFASRLAMAGVDLRTIQELGGWKMLKLVERYSHLSPSHKAEAIEKIAAPSPITSPNTADCGAETKAVSN